MSTALPDFASTALNQRSMHVVLSLIAVASAPLHTGAQPRSRNGKIPGDPRAKNRIEDLLHVSSGLRIRASQDPDCDPSGPYPDVYCVIGTEENMPRPCWVVQARRRVMSEIGRVEMWRGGGRLNISVSASFV
jgi:hypothetical protein